MNIQAGEVIARSYTVLQVKKGPVPSLMSQYVSDALIIELDSKYENQSRLSIYPLSAPVPPVVEWPFLFPGELPGLRVAKSWTPTRLKPPCGATSYKVRTPQGTLLAVVQMAATSDNALVVASTSWAGFPLINWFYVGFKLGMETRTEELLEAGLQIARQVGSPTSTHPSALPSTTEGKSLSSLPEDV